MTTEPNSNREVVMCVPFLSPELVYKGPLQQKLTFDLPALLSLPPHLS